MQVYKITNLLTGMSYISQTKHSLRRRFNQHAEKSSKCTYLSNSIKKYGKSNFIITPVLRCDNLDELNRREKMCIRLYQTLNPHGYNLTEGGHNGTHCAEVRDKLRKSRLGTKSKPETILKLIHNSSGGNNPMFGKKHSIETKEKITRALTGKSTTKKGKKIGAIHTEESKRKLSDSAKGNKFALGTKHTDEFKKRRSEICTKQNQKKVINTKTGEILHTAKSLVAVLNRPYSTIINMLNGTNLNKLDWIYLIDL